MAWLHLPPHAKSPSQLHLFDAAAIASTGVIPNYCPALLVAIDQARLSSLSLPSDFCPPVTVSAATISLGLVIH
jgi:hypothetical protein